MTAARLTLPSPAKLNLMLHILGRREDGYHELQTLFQFVDYGDEITFAVRDDGVIQLHTEFTGVPHDSNLIVRAAKMLQQQSGCALGIDIWIEKVLPMGGGIGGGSSNAATTLLGLNHLWQLGWDEDRLATLGLTLGADVPVFVRGHAAFAEGVGEKLTPVDPEEPWPLRRVFFCLQYLSTARALPAASTLPETAALSARVYQSRSCPCPKSPHPVPSMS